jgi:hypothetical protein
LAGSLPGVAASLPSTWGARLTACGGAQAPAVTNATNSSGTNQLRRTLDPLQYALRCRAFCHVDFETAASFLFDLPANSAQPQAKLS